MNASVKDGRLRVLQVYRDYFTELPGGIERHVYDLAHGLNGIADVHVLASARRMRGRSLDDDGVPVHLVGEVARPGGVAVCPGYLKEMRRARYDLIHLHCPNPTGEMSFRFVRGTPAVATYHADTERNSLLLPAYERLLVSVLSRCEKVIATSERLVGSSRVLSSIAKSHPERISIVPLGVDVERFSPARTEGSASLRATWGPAPIVLFVGRIRRYKGLEHLIEAMSSVDARLVIAGDGPERSRVGELGKRTLGRRFTMVPQVSEDALPDVYRAADVYCLPSISRSEAFGMALVEAMASGLPVVTTELDTGTSIVNRHRETGLVVPPRDPSALAAAVEKILGDDALARSMSTDARERAVDEYDMRLMLKRIAALYASVAGVTR